MREKDAAEIVRLADEVAEAHKDCGFLQSLHGTHYKGKTLFELQQQAADARAKLRAALEPFIERDEGTTVTAQRTACTSCGMIYGHAIGCPLELP